MYDKTSWYIKKYCILEYFESLITKSNCQNKLEKKTEKNTS